MAYLKYLLSPICLGALCFFNCLLLRSLFYRKIATIRFAGFLHRVFYRFSCCKWFRAFSLVWGQVASAAIMLLLAWSQTRYTPQFRLTFGSLASFVFRVVGFDKPSLNNIAGKVDAMIIGKFIGAAQLGQYFRTKVGSVLPSLVSGQWTRFFCPHTRLQDHSEKSNVHTGIPLSFHFLHYLRYV